MTPEEVTSGFNNIINEANSMLTSFCKSIVNDRHQFNKEYCNYFVVNVIFKVNP